MTMQIMIQGTQQTVLPCISDSVQWVTERKGMPGKLTFSVLWQEGMSLEEGSPVSLQIDGRLVFYGFLFRAERDRSGVVRLTAYDQMRYLKNKDTYVFEAVTASDVISMIAGDYGLRVGAIAATGYQIPSLVEENATLLDMMQEALDMTLTSTRRLYVLYDNAGKLTLSSAESMHVGIVIDEETGQNYAYTSTIDENTYNRVKLVHDDGEGGQRQVFIAQDAMTQARWGTLQYYEAIDSVQNAQARADTLLAMYNRKTRRLKISGAVGDLRVRAGSFVIIRLNLGDVKLDAFMLVEVCTHTFGADEHWMDLTLRGGDFVG